MGILFGFVDLLQEILPLVFLSHFYRLVVRANEDNRFVCVRVFVSCSSRSSTSPRIPLRNHTHPGQTVKIGHTLGLSPHHMVSEQRLPRIWGFLVSAEVPVRMTGSTGNTQIFRSGSGTKNCTNSGGKMGENDGFEGENGGIDG